MKIKELLDSPKVTISCELFPPKKGTELQNAMDIVHAIAIDGVDYMSVTYGAGGTAVGKSLAIASEVERSRGPGLGPSNLYRCEKRWHRPRPSRHESRRH